MNYGMYLSAASLRISHARMDALANNMANVNTTSFKQDLAVVRSRPAPVEDNAIPGDWVIPVLDDISGGLGTGGAWTDFSQGKIQPTGADWDLALQGEGFLALRDAEGRTVYSRDGRLSVRDGALVTAAEGLAVLDGQGRPITGVPAGRPTVDAQGTVRVGDWSAELGRWSFEHPHLLAKQGANAYLPAPDAGRRTAADLQVRQGYVEGSGVDPTRTLVEMINVQRAYDASAKMIQFTDTMLGRAVNDIARIS